MRGVKTGGAHDHKVDCPSQLRPFVYVLLGISRLLPFPAGVQGGW